MFTNKEIKDKMHEALVAKFKDARASYSCWEIYDTIREVLKEVIKDTNYKFEDFKVETSRDSKWVVNIVYRNWSTAIQIRCKRYISKNGYWSKEYAYKDFEVDIFGYGKTFYELLTEIDGYAQKRLDTEAELDRRAEHVLRYIMEKYGVTDYQAKEICKRANDKYYTLLKEC